MINIIRSQIYKIIHNKVFYITLIVSCALSGLNILDILDMNYDKITGSLIAVNNGALTFGCVIFIGIISAQIIGSDLLDKTINYEVLFGHKKEQYILLDG